MEIPAMDRGELRQWAREEWPSPVVAIGWCRLVLNSGGRELVNNLINQFHPGWKDVPGKNFGRDRGKRFAWGATLYESDDRPFKETPSPIFDCPETGVQSIRQFDGDVFDGGGKFWRKLAQDGNRCTRLDVSIDFVGYEIDPIEAAYVARDFLGFRSCSHVDSRGLGERGGRTFYFGNSRGGGSFCRWYEKGAQLGESYPILRFELQAMHEDAESLFPALMNNPREVAAGCLTRVDFREGAGELKLTGKASRAKRFEWWQQLVDFAGEVRGYDRTLHREASMERMLLWVKTAWPKPLGKLRLALGDEGLRDLLNTLLESDAAALDEFEREEVSRWSESSSPMFL